MTTPSKILVIYNRVADSDFAGQKEVLAEDDNITMAQSVAETLAKNNFTTELFQVDEDSINKIPELKFDLIFNLTEGIGSLPKSDFLVAKFLEDHKLPFTGSNSTALALTGNKIDTKNLLLKNNLPTAKFYFFNSSQDPVPDWLNFPLIVKPIGMHCSIGISTDSVVENQESLRTMIEAQQKDYNELFFVEEYIDGREVNVALLGNGGSVEVLPPSEIIFSKNFPSKFKVVDFNAKWVEDSATYQSTLEARCPAEFTEETRAKIYAVAKKAFLLSGCSDYARIDLRVTKDGTPVVLEVNANQGLAPDTGTVRSAKAGGYSYPALLEKIIDVAADRLWGSQ